jgi:hypothetical protein
MKASERTDITIEMNGVTYGGWFETSRGLVTVHTLYGSKSTQTGNTPPEVLAKMMLRELVEEEKGRKDPMV